MTPMKTQPMKTQLKCFGIIFDLSPQPFGGGYFSTLLDHQVEDLLTKLAEEYPSSESSDLRRIAATMLHQLYPEYSFTIIRPGGNIPSRVAAGMQVQVDAELGTLTVDHTGYSIRTLQGAAAGVDPKRRRWKVVVDTGTVQYVAGEILLQTNRH